MSARQRATTLLLFFGVFAGNVTLNAPLFLPGEMIYRGSIEGGYAAMARFFAFHPNPWGWNPLQYCGLPARFTYLPGVPYLAALLIRLQPTADPVHMYRIVVASLACLGPASLFLFVLYFTKSRGWAAATAAAYSIFSPSYGLIEEISHDRGVVYLPWRIQLLAKYGEGPHNAGLTLLPIAIVALWAAAVGKGFKRIFSAAVALAAVALTNWVAALALALCCYLAMVTGVPARLGTGFRGRRVLAAGALAYLFACFWLTPRFIKTTAFNWPVDAFGYHARIMQWILLAGLVGGVAVIRLVFVRFPEHSYLCFLTLAVFTFGYVVLNYYWYGVDTIPESRRYALEFELFLFAFLLELLRQAMESRTLGVRWLAAGITGFLLYAGAGQARAYVTQGYQRWNPLPREETVEYRLARWIEERRPTGRVLASGGARFRLNCWFDLAQAGGTFESGLANRIPLHLAYHVRAARATDQDKRQALRELKAMGVEYLVINGPNSQEYYRDFKDPWKFEGLLDAVYRERDDVIYRIPFDSIAHLVRREELPNYPQVGSQALVPYVAAIDDAFRPKLRTVWHTYNELEIQGEIPVHTLVSVQMNFHPGWAAVQNGVPIRIERDNLGFLALDAQPSHSATIILTYRGTTGERLMAGISGLAWLRAIAGLFLARRRRTREAIAPSVVKQCSAAR